MCSLYKYKLYKYEPSIAFFDEFAYYVPQSREFLSKDRFDAAYSAVALRQLAEVERAKLMFIVYAVYNSIHDKVYIGQTEDLVERLQAHNEHRFRQAYTSRFSGEWVVIYQEMMPTRKAAIAREKQLKSFRGREFIRKQK